jgi:hypothetical protein
METIDIGHGYECDSEKCGMRFKVTVEVVPGTVGTGSKIVCPHCGREQVEMIPGKVKSVSKED